MNTAGRLGVYGAGLVLVFGGAFAAAGAVVPESTVAAWTEASPSETKERPEPAGHTEETSTQSGTDEQKGQEADVTGVTIADAGYRLTPVQAPAGIGQAGTLSFQILDAAGDPVTEFQTAHDKELHLIVVRSDGTGFRHVHPDLDRATGTWSLPWTWDAAGTYRVYTDFTAGTGPAVTLSRTVDVAGPFEPQPPTGPVTSDTVDGLEVTLTGDLTAGQASELTVEVTRDSVPVTDLEPYLGAFGHLVALRQGDLAYLHVHAHGDEPQPGDLAGPNVAFTAETPTAGRYLLYLDFQVDGQVHTAEFVLDAAATSDTAEAPAHTDDGHGH